MEARVKAIAVCAALTAPITAWAQAPSFTLLGAAPNTLGSVARATSADGGVVAGYSVDVTGAKGFTWTQGGGRSDFGLLPGMPALTEADAISGDGSTVVGAMTGPRAFRRVGDGSLQDLGVLTGYTRSAASGASNDGSIVVGYCASGAAHTSGQAFRWTSSGMQGLGFTQGPNGVYSEATAISRDGTTIIGNSEDFGGFTDAFVWRNGAFTVLPQLPDTPFPSSFAYGVNFDGGVVVGASGARLRAALWRNGVVNDLGIAAGWAHSRAQAVSDDGNLVGCVLYTGGNQLAAVWTPATGMEPLADYLIANGVTIPQGWTLETCTSVSGDGHTVVGSAYSLDGYGYGFVATIPTSSSIGALLLGLIPTFHRRRAQ
jgi:probable HAF family extracellular repeat protein